MSKNMLTIDKLSDFTVVGLLDTCRLSDVDVVGPLKACRMSDIDVLEALNRVFCDRLSDIGV